MALSASHIRFAMDLVHHRKYSPEDINQYISGTMYPDSRWTTNIERELTHLEQIPDLVSASNDFKLGWMVHCRYDEIQNQHHRRLQLPQEVIPKDKWVHYSALKVIQDMNDVKYISEMDLRQYMSVRINPNDEDIAGVDQFYELIIEVYNQKLTTELSDYSNLWLSVGLEPAKTKIIIGQIEVLINKKKLSAQIQNLYQQSVLDYLEQY